MARKSLVGGIGLFVATRVDPLAKGYAARLLRVKAFLGDVGWLPIKTAVG